MRCFLFVGLSFLLFSCSSDDSGGGSGGTSAGGTSAGGTSAGGTSSGGTSSGGSGGSATGGSAGTATGGSAGTAAGDTWGNFAQDFFASYCIECHEAGDTKRDYTTIDNVIRDQDEIACGVSATKLDGCASFPPPGQFPIDNATHNNPKPDTALRARLVAWIQAGLPE